MQYSTVAHCSSFSDTLKEKYETIHIKLIELENILRAKALAKNEVFNLENGIRLMAGNDIVSLFAASSSNPRPSDEDGYLGTWFGRWNLYLDTTKDPNSVAIVTSSGSALLVVHNLF